MGAIQRPYGSTKRWGVGNALGGDATSATITGMTRRAACTSWIRASLGIVAVLVGSCDSDFPSPSVDPIGSSIPTITSPPTMVFEATWGPNGDRMTVAELTAVLEEFETAGLFPADLLDVATSHVWLGIFRSGSAPLSTSVSASETGEGEENRLSVTATRAGSDGTPSCDIREAGEVGEGSPGWLPKTIRGVGGCTATNASGLTFIEWQESGLWLHVETVLQMDEASEWLGHWEILP